MTAAESTKAAVVLPPWSVTTARRRRHIARVSALALQWADAIGIGGDERCEWEDAALLHDALRDAPESQLRALSGQDVEPAEILHGPAAAAMLERLGERRTAVIEAIRWHTVGHASWSRAGRALYMADYLEPGRPFLPRRRARLAERVPVDFDGVFREVVRQRLTWTLDEGHAVYPESVALWNAVR